MVFTGVWMGLVSARAYGVLLSNDITDSDTGRARRLFVYHTVITDL